ncbi:MAG: NAD(P)H-dependent oxidoreductase [Alphaproteobacteria bacterium]
MARRILIVQGHPDPADEHLCHALADAYAEGARAAGHEVRRIEVARLDVPLLRSKADFDAGEPPPVARLGQQAIEWAEHLVIVYPLWLGTMPALLKGWLEQVLRPGFAFEVGGLGWKPRLRGRSARVVVTMGMPALAYRLFYFSHSLRSLERNILKFVGVAPVRHTVVGGVDALRDAATWLDRLRRLGAAAR